jgi:tetratricopeptide (TPR) repeat protein
MVLPLQAGLTARCRSGFHILVLLLLTLLVSGCAGRLNKAGELFYADRPEESLVVLEKGDWAGQRNQLLFFMEQGLVLHQLGQFQRSADILLQAGALIRKLELLSLHEQAASLVTNEWLLRYKGEYNERLWVHSYLMMNFLLLAEYDSALVEAKQALDIIGRYPEALNGDYFSRALIALCFANVGEDNDAYLVYRRLAEDLPSPTPVAADLVAISSRLGQLDEVEHFRKYLPAQVPSGAGELVLFISNGRIATKKPGNVLLPPLIRFSFPYYDEVRTPAVQVDLQPARSTLPPLSTDLGALAKRALEERKLAIIMKETARVAAKETISQNVGNEHGPAAEALVRISLLLLEEPDTRSWQTLPGRLTLVRVPLAAGTHKLRLNLHGAGLLRPPEVDLPAFELRPGQRVFRALRF